MYRYRRSMKSAGTFRLDRPIVDSWFIIFWRGRVHGIISSSHILMPRRNGHAPLSIDGVPIERYTRAHRNGTFIAGRDAYRTKSSHPGVHVDQRTNFKRIQALTPVGTQRIVQLPSSSKFLIWFRSYVKHWSSDCHFRGTFKLLKPSEGCRKKPPGRSSGMENHALPVLIVQDRTARS
jgi:hypothetical protein